MWFTISLIFLFAFLFIIVPILIFVNIFTKVTDNKTKKRKEKEEKNIFLTKEELSTNNLFKDIEKTFCSTFKVVEPNCFFVSFIVSKKEKYIYLIKSTFSGEDKLNVRINLDSLINVNTFYNENFLKIIIYTDTINNPNIILNLNLDKNLNPYDYNRGIDFAENIKSIINLLTNEK